MARRSRSATRSGMSRNGNFLAPFGEFEPRLFCADFAGFTDYADERMVDAYHAK
jgi:hypothetical protein